MNTCGCGCALCVLFLNIMNDPKNSIINGYEKDTLMRGMRNFVRKPTTNLFIPKYRGVRPINNVTLLNTFVKVVLFKSRIKNYQRNCIRFNINEYNNNILHEMPLEQFFGQYLLGRMIMLLSIIRNA